MSATLRCLHRYAAIQVTKSERAKGYHAGCGSLEWMGAVSTQLIDEARSIFRDLGYEVSTEGEELRAERKWRIVHVTTAEPSESPTTGRLRCFVANAERAQRVREELLETGPDYDWAVIGVDDGGDYRVLHPDADVLPAP